MPRPYGIAYRLNTEPHLAKIQEIAAGYLKVNPAEAGLRGVLKFPEGRLQGTCSAV